MLACRLPVVAACVGAMTHLFADVPSCLYRSEDAADLARALLAQLDQPMMADVPIDDWAQLTAALEPRLRALCTPSSKPNQ